MEANVMEKEKTVRKLDAEELETASGGIELRTRRLCPDCGQNLFQRYVVFPRHRYVYYCEHCRKTIRDMDD